MKKRIAFGLVILVIILSNIFRMPTIGETFNYQTQDGEFTYNTIPSKGISEMNMDTAFANYQLKNPQHKDLILYRTFSRNWLKFWCWSDYLINDRWEYPYLAI